MNSLGGKKAQPLSSFVGEFLKSSRLSTGMNTHLIYSAWDDVTGVGDYTLKRFLKEGKLFVTMSSSVVASQLVMQRDIIVQRINEKLAENPLFTRDDPNVGYVKEVIIK